MRRPFVLLLVAIGLASLVLGTVGFYDTDKDSGWPTAIYRAAQLFYWNSSFGVSVPWMLEIARWFAPLITFGALAQLGLTVFRKRWDHFRARRLRDHTLIIGAGEKGAILAEALRQSRTLVVDRDSTRIDALLADGSLALQGDATLPETLRQASAPHAARVVIATGDDHRNLGIALAAAQLGTRSIHASCSDASLCDLYQRHHALTSAASGSVRIFNHERNLARATVQAFPPDSAAGDVHVILPGLSPLAGALVVQYALMGHFPDDRRIHLHLVGPDASAELDAWRTRYPGLGHCLTVEAIDLVQPELFAPRVADLVRAATGSFTIFPDLAEETRAFSRSLELMEHLSGTPVRLLLLSRTDDSPTRALVTGNPSLARSIAYLPPPSETCGPEAVLAESLDRTARRIHEKWLEETKRQITAARAAGDEALAQRHETKATYRPWPDLSEEQRGASRSQADHIPFKIRAAGLDPANVTSAAWAKLPPTQIETLARLEHARWSAYLWMTGWTHAPERNDARKQHPNLVPYDALDEPTKDYDREAIRNVADYLSEVTSTRPR